jgi:hypothetical protein
MAAMRHAAKENPATHQSTTACSGALIAWQALNVHDSICARRIHYVDSSSQAWLHDLETKLLYKSSMCPVHVQQLQAYIHCGREWVRGYALCFDSL